MPRVTAIDRKIAELEAERDRLASQIAVLKSLRSVPKPRVVKPKAVS